MDKQTVLKVLCIGVILLLIALVIEKRHPVTSLPMDFRINNRTEKSSDYVNDPKEVTIYVSDLNGLIFPITLDVTGTKAEYRDDVELTFSMLTEYSNYLPMGVKTIVPPSTRLIDYKKVDGNLILNVSKEFLNYHTSDIDKIIDIMTYSFTEMNGVSSVTVVCEDQPIKAGGTETFNALNKDSRLLNTVFTADELSNSRTMTVYYYTSAQDNYYLVPVNVIVNKNNQSDEALIKEILVSYYINIPVTSYINEENIITVDQQLSNMKSGYTNIDDDFSLKQYYYTLIANSKEESDSEVQDYNKYNVELR